MFCRGRRDNPEVIGNRLPGQSWQVDPAVSFYRHSRNTPHDNRRVALVQQRRDRLAVIKVKPAGNGQDGKLLVLVQEAGQGVGHGLVLQIRSLHKALGLFAV